MIAALRRVGLLRAVTSLVLVMFGVTAMTAAVLFAGFGSGPVVTVHMAAAACFFVALCAKLVLLGGRARPRRARRLWRLLVAQLGGALAAYTLLTGVLVLMSSAWSDQHLAASFWLGVLVAVHIRHYARRLRRARGVDASPAELSPALRRRDAPAIASLDVSVPRGPEPALRASLPAGSRRRRRLLVVGGGMAGQAVAERMAEREGWSVTLLAEEDIRPYNRIALSGRVRGETSAEQLALRPAGWYLQSGVTLCLGAGAVKVDAAQRMVTDCTGAEHAYDALVLATGSRAFVPPITGADLEHVVAYRTLRDADTISAAAGRIDTAVVIGGGLLGLEAAAALAARNLAVTAIETSDRLMPQQLDDGASTLLRGALSRIGIETVLGAGVHEITASHVRLKDGRRFPAGLVVVAAGIRAETALARTAGLQVARGIAVDDQMRTSAAGIWAVGECAEHRGVVHGLWTPIVAQLDAVTAALDGVPSEFVPRSQQATLKVAGLELMSLGRTSAGPGDDEVIHSDGRRGRYAKLVIDGDRLVGAILLGDTTQAGRLRTLMSSGEPLPADVLQTAGPPRGDERESRGSQGDEDTVCVCMAVSRGRIADAIDAGALRSVREVAAATGATTGCGGCTATVASMLAPRVGRSPPTSPSPAPSSGLAGDSDALVTNLR